MNSFNEIFLNRNDIMDNYRAVPRQMHVVAPVPRHIGFPTKPQKILRSQDLQSYPAANLQTMMNYVTIVSTPDEICHECASFLTELDMKNYEMDLLTGNIKGYFFQDAKNVKFSLQIRGQEGADLFLDATRLTGDAFVFADFWKALSTYLTERGHTEEELQDSDDDFSFLEFSDDEDMELDMADVKFLKFNECSETLKFMIDDMHDPNFRETCASTLAYNCADQQNMQAMMQYGQELFDTLIACIFCSMANCYFSQLPFYRSAALLLDAVFDNQAVQMVSVEQYETLVAATKNWALQSQNIQGEITISEEIATILSRQLTRIAPPVLSEQAQSDLFEMRHSPFHSVKQHAREALTLVR